MCARQESTNVTNDLTDASSFLRAVFIVSMQISERWEESMLHADFHQMTEYVCTVILLCSAQNVKLIETSPAPQAKINWLYTWFPLPNHSVHYQHDDTFIMSYCSLPFNHITKTTSFFCTLWDFIVILSSCGMQGWNTPFITHKHAPRLSKHRLLYLLVSL